MTQSGAKRGSKGDERSETPLFTIGSKFLNPGQINILDECLIKNADGGGGLAVPMGTGKTLISILVALAKKETSDPILVVCSKSLIPSWVTEIKKFFGDSLRYVVLHQNSIKNMAGWVMPLNTDLVLTTAEVTSKYYRELNVHQRFTYYTDFHVGNLPVRVLNFRPVDRPFMPAVTTGPGILYAREWSTLIVDEAQNYTNATNNKCFSVAALCSDRRWLLSGTMFNEPKTTRIFGYYLLLNRGPKTLPDTETLITDPSFPGLRPTLVYRSENKAYKKPTVETIIVEHTLSREEGLIYKSMKETLKLLKDHYNALRARGDGQGVRKFSSYILAMINYVRQALICPLLPVTTIFIEVANTTVKSELATILNDQLATAQLTQWLNDIESIRSTRIRRILGTISDHPNQKVVFFSSFRTCINVIRSYLSGRSVNSDNAGRQSFTLSGSMTLEARDRVINQFNASTNGVLFLTFDIGANGLNLQGTSESGHTSVVIIGDLPWNYGVAQQAISRVIRFGNHAPKINVYYMSSNTAVELALLKKMHAKRDIGEELMDGHKQGKIPAMKTQEILNLITCEENTDSLNGLITGRRTNPIPEPVALGRPPPQPRYIDRFDRGIVGPNVLSILQGPGHVAAGR